MGEMDVRSGLSRDGLLDALEEILQAERTVFFAHEGRVKETRTVKDYGTRRAALEMALRLRGEFPSAKLDVNIRTPMEQLPDLSHLPIEQLLQIAGIALDEAQSKHDAIPMPPVQALIEHDLDSLGDGTTEGDGSGLESETLGERDRG